MGKWKSGIFQYYKMPMNCNFAQSSHAYIAREAKYENDNEYNR